MISPDKIEEWIREVEQRPASAALIIQYIANRLSELAAREEELAAQNIELLNGRKVEEYESRIASLEYQLDLLKRQLGGEVVLPVEMPLSVPAPELISLLIYNPSGQVLRTELSPSEISPAITIATMPSLLSADGRAPSILATSSQEELLFLFDTGRTVTHPVSQLPLSGADQLDWQQATIEEPRVKEELAQIQPIAKMPLYETAIQTSRRGFVKKMKTAFFTTHLAEGYIGSGVKLPADRTCGLTFASKNDLFAMVSQEGFIFSMPCDQLPTAIEEVIHLAITDHIVAFFTPGQKTSIMFITQNGKAVHRETSWLEPANSFRSKGQALLSRERRDGGTRIVGAAPVGEADWGVFLHSDGRLTAHKLTDLVSAGTVLPGQPPGSIVSMTSFQIPEVKIPLTG